MTEDQIKYTVSRFLGWKLPEHFNPDGGISFKKFYNEHLPTPSKSVPVGTNLFDAGQATDMVRYMVQGMPEAKDNALQVLGEALIKFAPDLAKELSERWKAANAAQDTRLEAFLAVLRT